MEHLFSRTELLIGKEGLSKLNRSTVIVFGIGGVGSYVAEALARTGIGHLVLVDYDEIALTNINRQLHALHSTIGQAKVDAMKKRILDINPQARVEAIKAFYSEENAGVFWDFKPDYVVDAIDTVSSKVSLAKECLRRGIPLISSMGAGNRLSALNYRVADISKTSGDPLAKAMRRLLRQVGIEKGVKVVYSPDPSLTPQSLSEGADLMSVSAPDLTPVNKRQVPGSIAFVPSVVGLLLAGEVVNDLLGSEK